MEYVEGPTLERLVGSRALDGGRAIRMLDDVLAGLAALHEKGLAHLDVNPRNVVLRKQMDDAVLVDFGLAGRRLRPGCGAGAYLAPEIWTASAEGDDPPAGAPGPADVYAFGCVAYETLTGEVLFAADTEAAQIALHADHDGKPPRIEKLASGAETAALAELLASALRKDPAKRATASELRERLRALRPWLAMSKWPLDV
jgi:serine/threonine protein kinase